MEEKGVLVTQEGYEKLEKEGLGSLCARLGNKANIDSFFSSLSSKESIRTAFRNIERKPNVNEIKELEEKVKKIYNSIARKAKYQSVINELETEKTANDYNRIIIPKSIQLTCSAIAPSPLSFTIQKCCYFLFYCF